MDKKIIYDFSDNFIDKLAGLIEENYLSRSNDISKLAIVFEGKRPALFLRKALANRIKRPFFAPRFFSIEEFVDYIVSKDEPFAGISDLDDCFLIYNLSAEIAPDILKSKRGFSEFLPWAREISSFIEQLDLENIGTDALKNIEEKADIGYDVPESINNLLKSINSIREAYHSRLEQKQTYSRGMRYLNAVRRVKNTSLPEFDQIYFCGFSYPHKTEENIINELCRKQKASHITSLPTEDILTDSKCPKISLMAGFDAHSQVCLTREILKTIPDLDKTVIVLPESDNLIPLLTEISAVCSDFNVSMGYSLKRSSLYALLESIFKAQETRKDKRYYTKDYLNVLAHPLIKNLKFLGSPSAMRILAHKIEETLSGAEKTKISGSLFLDLSDLENLRDLYDLSLGTMKKTGSRITYDELKPAVKRLHDILFGMWEDIADFYRFAKNIGYFMDILIKESFLSDYPLNLKMAEKIYRIGDELINSSFNKETFKNEDLVKIFKNKIDSEKISFFGSPLKGLQILGLLETRCLSFENVVILDVNESVLPKLRIYEPLVPREIMVGLGLKSFEKEEENQRYQFKRLISSAKNVYLLYQQSADKEKSRFIEEIIWEKEKQDKTIGALPAASAAFRTNVLPKKSEIKKTGRIAEFLKKKEYSSSSINIYLHCPLKFYYRYVLGLEEKENLLDGFESKDVGNFIHELLESVFAEFINKRPVIDNDFQKRFWAKFDKKFKEDFEMKSGAESFLIKEIMVFRLKKFLDNEKERDVEKILCLEKKFCGEIEVEGMPIRFQARVDRIDKLRGGGILIIDYKTGGSDIMPDLNPEQIKSCRPCRQTIKNTVKSFQLPLYLYLSACQPEYKNKEINAGLYSLRDSTLKKFVGIDRQKPPDNNNGNIAIYLELLKSVVSDILNPDVLFNADHENPRYCEFCPFFYLCR